MIFMARFTVLFALVCVSLFAICSTAFLASECQVIEVVGAGTTGVDGLYSMVPVTDLIGVSVVVDQNLPSFCKLNAGVCDLSVVGGSAIYATTGSWGWGIQSRAAGTSGFNSDGDWAGLHHRYHVVQATPTDYFPANNEWIIRVSGTGPSAKNIGLLPIPTFTCAQPRAADVPFRASDCSEVTVSEAGVPDANGVYTLFPHLVRPLFNPDQQLVAHPIFCKTSQAGAPSFGFTAACADRIDFYIDPAGWGWGVRVVANSSSIPQIYVGDHHRYFQGTTTSSTDVITGMKIRPPPSSPALPFSAYPLPRLTCTAWKPTVSDLAARIASLEQQVESVSSSFNASFVCQSSLSPSSVARWCSVRARASF